MFSTILAMRIRLRSYGVIRRIVLADDHPIVLSGLCSLIEAEDDLEVIGSAMKPKHPVLLE